MILVLQAVGFWGLYHAMRLETPTGMPKIFPEDHMFNIYADHARDDFL